MQIGSYQVLFELGRGGMGRVYLGRTVGAGGFERLVAIKRAHPDSSQSPELSQRFLNEARLAGYVHHANVVSMHQAGSDADGDYLVCDYVEGESLAGLTERARVHGAPQPAIVARILLDGLAGLQAAHDAVDPSGAPLGMLHRDVSMDNLLVGRDGVTRLADFGIAKSRQSSVVTEPGLLQGKLIYFSPEYLRGLAVDRTIDIYAMGVTLWSALAGALPWRDREEPQLMHAILMEGIPSLASTGCALDPGFDAIIAKACCTDPSRRFPTAREMHDALEVVAKGSAGVASQVEVAEHVERVMGTELAARRERIRAQRSALQAAERGTGTTADAERQPVSIEGAFNPVEASTGYLVREAWRRSRRSQRLFYTGMLVLALAAGYAALTLYAGGETRETRRPPQAAAPAAPPPPAPVAPGAPETVQPDEPPEASIEGSRAEPRASTASESSEPHAPPPAALRTRPRLPERATLRKSHGISTRNPYRRDDP